MIAEKLGGVHGLQVPINKEPTYLTDTMTRWLHHIRTAVHAGTARPDDRAKVRKLLSYSLEKEYDWITLSIIFLHTILLDSISVESLVNRWHGCGNCLDFLCRKMMPKVNSPVIFSHNDLQEGKSS